jgi:PQQ-like domain
MGTFVTGVISMAMAAPLAAAATPSSAAATSLPPLSNPLGIDLQWQTTLPDPGGPVAESSPNVATIDGVPSVVVGDRSGNVFAFPLDQADPAKPAEVGAGWPAKAAGPVDSTPSVATAGTDAGDIYVGSGNAFDSDTVGGYQAIGASGAQQWFTPVQNPATDAVPAAGVQASLTVGTLQGQTAVVAGSLGQEAYALNGSDGAALTGWPFFTSDSTFSTAAVGDLYGTGHTEIVEGGAQTGGFALGQKYPQGGHVRILNDSGGLVCHFDTDQTVDSSPAIGGFLPGGATGIVVGTGSFFADATDTDTVMAFDTHCGVQWQTRLDGDTDSSPALADVMGNGALQVVEGTDNGTTGSVWALDAATGAALWHTAVSGRVIGSVVTADLSGSGYQDVVVPTTTGVDILDGQTGALIQTLLTAKDPNGNVGFQNSPLVTDDPNGTIGITLAGYGGPANQGFIYHYEIPGSNGASVNEAGAWPMFHHDPQLTGDAGDLPPPGAVASCTIPEAALAGGYDLVASDGGIFSFGGSPFCGSTGALTLNSPIVGMAMAPNTGGYWLVAADGGVFAYGGAQFYGSTGNIKLNQPIVGMAATPDGKGYWLVAADGGIFAFGDAQFFGSTGNIKLNQPIVGMAPTADGDGYRLVAADGGIFAYGDAQFFGSTGNIKLNQPIVGMATDAATGGYWLVAADGGVFSYQAPFYGSTGNLQLNRPIVGMQASLNGTGYRFVAADGGVFSFGAAQFEGSTGGAALNRPVVAMAGF